MHYIEQALRLYMSKEWEGACRVCVEYAAKYNMQVWLYDEFNWPSGSCKGRVTDGNDEFVFKRFAVMNDTVKVEGKGNNRFSLIVSGDKKL